LQSEDIAWIRGFPGVVDVEIISEEPTVFRIELRNSADADTFVTASRHLLELDVVRKSEIVCHLLG
jgi:hypothetical protein